MPDPSRPTEPAPGPLATEHAGPATGPVVVLAHGFTQTARTWGPLADDLARDHRLALVDLPGHGGSAGVAADLVDGARLLGDAGGPGAYVGYSMGARFCLHLALARPDLVRSLVLISGTAGIDDPDERADRRAADGALADRLDPPAGGPTAEPLDDFLETWVAGPLFADVPREALALAGRRRNTPRGLASSLRLAGTGTQTPLWGRLGELSMPLLVVTGGSDRKFIDLGRRLVAAVGPSARQVVVPGTGHAPHLVDPAAVAAAVRAHLGG